MPDHDEPRRDLAAMLQPLTKALIAAELPVLERHGITMWGYVVLNALDGTGVGGGLGGGDSGGSGAGSGFGVDVGAPARTQAALAQAIGADKTRIIATLDALQAAGLITREPDPSDRRARLLSITKAGRRIRRSVQSEIQSNENRVLSRLSAGDRRAFLRVVRALSELEPEEFLGPAGK